MTILDTSAIFALLNEEDSLHTRAIVDFKELVEQGTIFVVEKLVLVEITTITNMRIKSLEIQKNIVSLCKSIINQRIDNWMYTEHTPTEFSQALKCLQNEDSKGLSFVDVLLSIVVNRYSYGKLLTYDDRLTKYVKRQPKTVC